MKTRAQRAADMTIMPLALVLAFLFLVVAAGDRMQASDGRQSLDLRGTWSGVFVSKNSDISPFSITVKINQDSGGHLVGDAILVSDCLKSHRLYVRVSGSNVELSGSDADGDVVAFNGTVDNTGTMLKLNYIIDGSPHGGCEIDDGTGTMAKL